jgi:hypothetical protein
VAERLRELEQHGPELPRLVKQLKESRKMAT